MLLSFILYDIYNFLIVSQLTILGALAPILDCEHPEDKNLVGVTIISYDMSNMWFNVMLMFDWVKLILIPWNVCLQSFWPTFQLFRERS